MTKREEYATAWIKKYFTNFKEDAPIIIGNDILEAYYAGYQSASQPFIDLLQIMLDPENQPPQFSKEEAWQKYLELTK